MAIIMLQKLTNVEKRINEIENEMKTALPYSKQYLEGQLSILKELNQKGIEI